MNLSATLVPRDTDPRPINYMSQGIPGIVFGAASSGKVEINLGCLSDPEDYLHDLAHLALALASDIRRARDTREPAAHHEFDPSVYDPPGTLRITPRDDNGFDERRASDVTS